MSRAKIFLLITVAICAVRSEQANLLLETSDGTILTVGNAPPPLLYGPAARFVASVNMDIVSAQYSNISIAHVAYSYSMSSELTIWSADGTTGPIASHLDVSLPETGIITSDAIVEFNANMTCADAFIGLVKWTFYSETTITFANGSMWRCAKYGCDVDCGTTAGSACNYYEGDMERAHKINVSAFMDRTRPDMAKCQRDFIDFFISQMVDRIGDVCPAIGHIAKENVSYNFKQWARDQSNVSLCTDDAE